MKKIALLCILVMLTSLVSCGGILERPSYAVTDLFIYKSEAYKSYSYGSDASDFLPKYNTLSDFSSVSFSFNPKRQYRLSFGDNYFGHTDEYCLYVSYPKEILNQKLKEVFSGQTVYYINIGGQANGMYCAYEVQQPAKESIYDDDMVCFIYYSVYTNQIIYVSKIYSKYPPDFLSSDIDNDFGSENIWIDITPKKSFVYISDEYKEYKVMGIPIVNPDIKKVITDSHFVALGKSGRFLFIKDETSSGVYRYLSIPYGITDTDGYKSYNTEAQLLTAQGIHSIEWTQCNYPRSQLVPHTAKVCYDNLGNVIYP